MFRYVKSVFRACFLIIRSYQGRLTNGRVLIYRILLALFVCLSSMDHANSVRRLLNEPMYEYHRSIKRKRALVKNR